MDFETEEQQLEAIKKWWKENSSNVIGGIAIGVTAIFGWQYYQQQTVNHAEHASILYEEVMIKAENPQGIDEVRGKVNQLEAEFADTPYASLAALVLAKQYFAADQYEKAQQQYEWVIANSQQDDTRYLAKLRLARLLLSDKQADKALNLLNENYPESFQAMALELKGDVLLSQNKAALARQAYQQALAASSGSNRWLQLKIDDIGDSSDQLDTSTGNTEPSA